jgi:hypothetical protein
MGLIEAKRVWSKLLPVAMAVLVMASVVPAHAAIQFQNLGTAAPPASLGGLPMTPFIQQGTCGVGLSTIPGCPIPGSLTVSPSTVSRFIGCGWATWSHGYTGDVYADYETSTVTLTLPAGTTAFYFYAEPDPFDIFDITATTNSGSTSGAVAVNGASGANGFGFYTDASDTIATITISSSVDFAFGEFGISNASTFTNSFYDDYGRSEFCVNFKTGYYQWTILSGQGAGNSYTGVGQVLNGNAKIVSPPGTTPVLNFTFSKLQKKAQGYFIPPPGWYSPLFDKNTADDPQGCAPPRPTRPDLQ